MASAMDLRLKTKILTMNLHFFKKASGKYSESKYVKLHSLDFSLKVIEAKQSLISESLGTFFTFVAIFVTILGILLGFFLYRSQVRNCMNLTKLSFV